MFLVGVVINSMVTKELKRVKLLARRLSDIVLVLRETVLVLVLERTGE
jgi:hypothetical protein